jgi:hypothetical protein
MITIIPEGEDKFKAVLSKDCEGWFLIAHAGSRFIQVLPPGMKHPITITTQIKMIGGIPRYENDWLTNPIKFRSSEKTQTTTPKVKK